MTFSNTAWPFRRAPPIGAGPKQLPRLGASSVGARCVSTLPRRRHCDHERHGCDCHRSHVRRSSPHGAVSLCHGSRFRRVAMDARKGYASYALAGSFDWRERRCSSLKHGRMLVVFTTRTRVGAIGRARRTLAAPTTTAMQTTWVVWPPVVLVTASALVHGVEQTVFNYVHA